MHILLIHQAFSSLDQPGGTRHHELAGYLAQRGHRVTVIASPVSYLTGKTDETIESDPPDADVSILRAYTYSALHRSFVHRVFSFFSFMLSSFFVGLKVKEVDLVWGTSPPLFQGFTAWALSRLKRVPYIFEVRDLWPAFAIQVGVLKNPLLIRPSEWLEGFLYRRAKLVVVNSPGFIPHVKERGAAKVELVSNGADPSMFDPTSEGCRFRQANGLEGKFLVMYAGAHGLSNDLHVILQAANLLQTTQVGQVSYLPSSNPDSVMQVSYLPSSQLPSITIVLLGDGKDKPDLQAQASELNLNNVLFLPPLPKSAMAEALAAADACIAILKPLPLYSTVYPNKVFDYMAAGRPVLLAIDGVIRQVIESAEAGLFIPPGDPEALARGIRQLASDPDLARRMGMNARRCVEERFDRQTLALHFAELIENIVTKI